LIRLDPIMIPTGTSGRFNADSYLVMFCKVWNKSRHTLQLTSDVTLGIKSWNILRS
jgi:hypothetical protein